MRSDGGGEFCFDGDFGDLCRDRGIKQEFTTADSPEMNGIAERALGMIEASAMAARLQAKEIFAGTPLPSSDRLWAESMRWACDCLNRTSTTANPENKSPYEMWHGKTAVLQLLPFLKPGFCRRKRGHKLEPKAQECYYLGPSMNHPHDAMRVLTKGRIVVTTRNVTWRRIPGIRQRPSLVRRDHKKTGMTGVRSSSRSLA